MLFCLVLLVCFGMGGCMGTPSSFMTTSVWPTGTTVFTICSGSMREGGSAATNFKEVSAAASRRKLLSATADPVLLEISFLGRRQSRRGVDEDPGISTLTLRFVPSEDPAAADSSTLTATMGVLVPESAARQVPAQPLYKAADAFAKFVGDRLVGKSLACWGS